MKLLVYGSAGWIGKQFTDILSDKGLTYVIGNSRVDNTTALEDEIKKTSPTHVISFIGRTHGT